MAVMVMVHRVRLGSAGKERREGEPQAEVGDEPFIVERS